MSKQIAKSSNGSFHSGLTKISESFLAYDIELLEREADLQSKQIELNECIKFLSQLVDLFKHTIIIPELETADDWHDGLIHQIKRNRGTTGNTLVDNKVEQIVLAKGLTTEQWQRLLALNFTAGDSLDMMNTSRSHLKKVHYMVSRLLENEEQKAAFALINAIEQFMPENHFIHQ